MSNESLQKVFKTLSDPTRVRILALLEAAELAVQELTQVLGMTQSRVSRHLAILREAGLLRDRRDGTFVFYHFVPPSAGPWTEAWALVRRSQRSDPIAQHDAASLTRVIEARSERSRSFFDSVGAEWDALRKVLNDDALRARAIARLIDPGLTVADLGTGTGILALELARLGLRVLAVDNSQRMLDATRQKLQREGIEGVELRRGELDRLPIADGEVDATLAHMVLHYVPSPADAIAEMARAVRPGGIVVVVDFLQHDLEWMRHELGVVWMGFATDELQGWLAGAGLERTRVEIHDPPSRERDLPATFIASARRPRSPL